MKVLVISSAAIPTPPPKDAYGGLELIVGNFIQEATKLGSHEITCYSATGSPLAGRWEVNQPENNIKSVLDVRETQEASWHAGEFEHYITYRDVLENEFGDGQGVVWDNSWQMWSYLSAAGGYFDQAGKWQDTITIAGGKQIKLKPHPRLKVVHTHHGMPNATIPPPKVKYPRFVGISKAHSQLLGNLMHVPVRTIHNGIQLDEYKEDEYEDRGYLLSLNRMTFEKGIHDSIDMAMQNEYPIKIVGDDTKIRDQGYAMQIIQKCRDSRGFAEYFGLVDDETKEEALKHCDAVIAMPINQGYGAWVEAFGLYAAEGGKYGKPFVGLANGGLMDIIDNGRTGFLGMTPTDVADFIPLIATIKADDCRKRIEENFSAKIMTQNYLNLFEKVLNDDIYAGKW